LIITKYVNLVWLHYCNYSFNGIVTSRIWA